MMRQNSLLTTRLDGMGDWILAAWLKYGPREAFEEVRLSLLCPPSLSQGFCCCDQRCHQKPLGEERIYPAVLLHHSSSSEEVRPGAEAGTDAGTNHTGVLPGAFLLAYFACFLMAPKTSQGRGGTAQSELGPLLSIINSKSALQARLQPDLNGSIFSIEAPCKMTLSCVKWM